VSAVVALCRLRTSDAFFTVSASFLVTGSFATISPTYFIFFRRSSGSFSGYSGRALRGASTSDGLSGGGWISAADALLLVFLRTPLARLDSLPLRTRRDRTA
jgi:hypothetical protein